LEEVTFECHPSSLIEKDGAQKIDLLRDICGPTKLRLSLGIQSLQPRLLQHIRLGSGSSSSGGNSIGYDKNSVGQLLALLSGASRLNLDFMYGYAPKEPESLEAELNCLKELLDNSVKPSAITFYQLWHGTDRVPELNKKKGGFIPLSERLLNEGFEYYVEPILSSRLEISNRLKELGYEPEVSSIWRRRDIHGADCIYHTDFLYGNSNVLPVGLSGYGYWDGLAFILSKTWDGFKNAINKDKRIPIELAIPLSQEEQLFRSVILSMKRSGATFDLSSITPYLGNDYAEKAIKLLANSKLVEVETDSDRNFKLTESGFILVEEIISWLGSAPPTHKEMLIGKARTVDRLARHALRMTDSCPSDDYHLPIEDCLTATNEHLDEVLRRCWPGMFHDSGRYANCICAVQSHKTKRPIFSVEHWYTPDDRKPFRLPSSKVELSKMQRYAIAREFFDSARLSNDDPIVSIFGMFFSPPRWFSSSTKKMERQKEGEDTRMAYYNRPPFLVYQDIGNNGDGKKAGCAMALADEDAGRRIDISSIILSIDQAIIKYGDEPQSKDDWWNLFEWMSQHDSRWAEELREKCKDFFVELQRLQKGIWPEAITQNIDALFKGFSNDKHTFRKWHFISTFCLYWALLKDAPDDDRQDIGRATGKLILHVPYFSYDDEAQGGAIVFLNGTADPTFEQFAMIGNAVDAILTRVGTREIAHHEHRIMAKMKRAECRAAAAAILARNMSHNIGSHVTPRTHLADLQQRVRDLLIQDDAWDGRDWNHLAFPMISELKDRLDEYIQRKAEFIAEFSTDPLISTRGAWFFQDVIRPLVTNTALMDTLAANEGFTYKTFDKPRLVICCRRKTEGSDPKEFKVQYRSVWFPAESFKWSTSPLGAPYAMRHLEYVDQELYPETDSKSGEGADDIRVALPGPVGEMAIYSILENIIRNAAKHGTGDRGPVEDRNPLYVDVLINDQGATSNYCDLEVWDNLTVPTDSLCDHLQGLIKEDIIDKSGQLRLGGWGTTEMVLCADLLNGTPPGQIPDAHALSVNCIQRSTSSTGNGDKTNRLVFNFKIPKARTAIFFGWEDGLAKQLRDDLASHGYPVMALDVLTKRPDVRLAACDFAVIDARELTAEQINAIHAQRHRLPFRIIMAGREPVEEVLGDTLKDWVKRCRWTDDAFPPLETPGQLATWLWKEWVAHMAKDVPAVGVDVFLQQKGDEQPTSQWKKNANSFQARNAGTTTPVAVRVWAQGLANRVECVTAHKEVQNNERRVVFDRHGIMTEEAGSGGGGESRIVFIDKQSADFDALFNTRFSEPWTAPYEMAEAGLLNILVIDERIAQNALKKFSGSGAGRDAFRRACMGNADKPVDVWHLARKAGVHIATHIEVPPAKEDDKKIVFDITKQDWTEKAEMKDAYVCVKIIEEAPEIKKIEVSNNMQGKLEDINAVIVHQGVIDRINGKVEGLGDRLLEHLDSRFWLIVESGRGIPLEVQKTNYKFLTFSAIEKSFRDGRVAKLTFSRMVMQANRHKSEGKSS